MEVIKETEEKMVKMEVDMDNLEIQRLIEYYDDNCCDAIKNEHKINWAVNNVLIKYMEKNNA